MASIQNSKARFYERAAQSGSEIEHTIESEADIFIKKLSQKQLDTNVTLEQQLHCRKQFLPLHIFQPESESTAGLVTLEHFKDLRANEEVTQNYETCHDNLSKNIHISRHAKELALAVKPNSLETKLLEFAISCHAVGHIQSDIRPHDHPINQLNDIEFNRFGHLSDDSNPTRTAKTILRKRQQLLESISEPLEIKRKPVTSSGKSLWDVTETSKNRNRRKNRLYTCPKERLFTIRDQKIIEIKTDEKEPEEEIRVAEVEKGDDNAKREPIERLSEDDIRELPKFSNYDRGTPNESLYLKNLAASVTENDLSSLFAKYQEPEHPCITYKLMKSGKMRGQAFIDCKRLETAEKAIDELNGVFLRGRPLIIQFSSSGTKKKTS